MIITVLRTANVNIYNKSNIEYCGYWIYHNTKTNKQTNKQTNKHTNNQKKTKEQYIEDRSLSGLSTCTPIIIDNCNIILYWTLSYKNIDWFVDFLCFNATFSNISAISWWPVLVVEEAGVPGENYRPWACNW